MRKLIWIVLVAAIAWSIWWFVGAAALRRGIDAAFDEMRQAGWEVSLEERYVRGFPNRFDTTIVGPDITDPSEDTVWRAPFVQILALSYRPNRVIVAFPETQELVTPLGSFDIDTASARGSVTLAPSPDLPLEHSEFVVTDMTIAGAAEAGLGELLFATRRPPANDDGRAHNIGVTIRAFDLPARISSRLDTPEEARIDHATLDATAFFPRVIDRSILSEGMPIPDRIEIDRLVIDWNEVSLSGSGMIEVAPDGQLSGGIDVEVSNWRGALSILARIGILPAAQLSSAEQGIGLLTRLGEDPDVFAAPLRFEEGRMFLGPLPLGSAPRLSP